MDGQVNKLNEVRGDQGLSVSRDRPCRGVCRSSHGFFLFAALDRVAAFAAAPTVFLGAARHIPGLCASPLATSLNFVSSLPLIHLAMSSSVNFEEFQRLAKRLELALAVHGHVSEEDNDSYIDLLWSDLVRTDHCADSEKLT